MGRVTEFLNKLTRGGAKPKDEPLTARERRRRLVEPHDRYTREERQRLIDEYVGKKDYSQADAEAEAAFEEFKRRQENS